MGGSLGALIGSYAPVSSSYESIATVTPSGTNTISFTSIPSTYKHLQIRFIANQADQASLTLRLNGDTSTVYARHQIEGSGTVAQASGNASGSTTGIFVVTAIDTTNVFSAGIIDVDDYVSTTKNKTVKLISGYDNNTGGRINLISGLYLSTSAITSLTLFVTGANFRAGSVFSLYGIKGA